MESTVPTDRRAGVPDLVGALDALDLRLLDPALEAEREKLLSAVSGYLVPRRSAPDGPIVVAVIGESGSGKSVIINSLARHPVSPIGALRPTTTAPVIWTAEPLPGTLDDLRLSGDMTVVTDGDGPPEGVVVVDTPPPHVPDRRGRSLAASVLDRADVCFLVTSSARYADAAAWSMLSQATGRHLPVVVVLNRLPEDPEIQADLVGDLVSRLIQVGVATSAGTAPLVTVAEGPLIAERSGLPPEWVGRVRKELDSLGDLAARRSTIARNLAAAQRRLSRGLIHLREAMVDAALVHGSLRGAVDDAYGLEIAQMRDQLARGRLADLDPTTEGLTADLAAIVSHRANRAARRTAEAWDQRPAGRRLLDEDPALWTHGAGVFDGGRERFADWDASLRDLVLDTLGRRRMRRRAIARYAGLIRREAIDPAFTAEGRRNRRRRRRLEDAPEVARHWLAGIAEEILGVDADRFRAVLGTEPSGDVLGRLVISEVGDD